MANERMKHCICQIVEMSNEARDMDDNIASVLAIHHNPGSFSDRWESSCRERGIQFIVVSLFEHSLIARLREQGVKKLLFNISDHTSLRTRLACA